MLVGCFLQRTVDWRWVFVCFQASGKNLNLNDESQHGLLMQLLKLSYNCLNYDFIGTSTDESSDDLCTVQIPTSWRSGSCAERDLITDVSFKGALCIDWCVYYWSHVSRTSCGSVSLYNNHCDSILHLNSIVEIEGSYWSISNLELKSFHLIITYSFIDYYCNFVITVGGEKTTRWA